MTETYRRPSRLAIALNLLGVGLVSWSLLSTHTPARAIWVLAVGLIAVAAWLLRTVLAYFMRPPFVIAVVMVLGGALAAAPSNGVAVVPALVGLMLVLSEPARPILAGVGLAIIAAVLVAVGAVPYGDDLLTLLSLEAGVAIAVLAGISRRQFRESETQTVLLRERELAVREEKAQVDLLAQRQGVARDIHDLLAHSLGGLVIQLDAVDALLEAGDVPGARRRAADARALAASGLGEARRAVDALRAPDAAPGVQPTVESFAASLDDLLTAHRTLGGAVELTETGERTELSSAQASALQRALQEALSNARKHAPGEPVQALLAWTDDAVRLTVSNPLSDDPVSRTDLAVSGGGHGLAGMRERFAELPLGGRAEADVDSGRFIVTAEAVLA